MCGFTCRTGYIRYMAVATAVPGGFMAGVAWRDGPPRACEFLLLFTFFLLSAFLLIHLSLERPPESIPDSPPPPLQAHYPLPHANLYSSCMNLFTPPTIQWGTCPPRHQQYGEVHTIWDIHEGTYYGGTYTRRGLTHGGNIHVKEQLLEHLMCVWN